MTIYEKIIAAYPELENSHLFADGTIQIQNDGTGDYLKEWNYSEPIPKGLKIGS